MQVAWLEQTGIKPYRSTLAEQVARQIVEKIAALRLQPGTEIPSEAELAAAFGVNRLVVREAMRILSAREMVVSRQGKQARVGIPSYQVIGELLDFRIKQGSLSLDDLFDTRQVLEEALVTAAATRANLGPGELAKAGSLISEMEDCASDRDRFIEIDVEFHRALAELAGNKILLLFLDSLRDVLLWVRAASYDGRVRRGQSHGQTIKDHREILAAVRDGQPQRARVAMAVHLAGTMTDLDVVRNQYVAAPGWTTRSGPTPQRFGRATSPSATSSSSSTPADGKE